VLLHQGQRFVTLHDKEIPSARSTGEHQLRPQAPCMVARPPDAPPERRVEQAIGQGASPVLSQRPPGRKAALLPVDHRIGHEAARRFL